MPLDLDDAERFFTYTYDDGSEHSLLPADEGAWSLEGIAHAATITTNFFIERKVRRRAPYSDQFRIFVGPSREGTWTTDFFVALARPDVLAGAAYGLGILGIPTLFQVFNRLTKRATGVDTPADASGAFEERQPGTFDALVEAVEPSLIRAHRVITDDNINITASLGPVYFTLNRRTKAYIEYSALDERPTRGRANVASYNVNSRTGRLYFEELGRTVPFYIDRNASDRTEIALGRSLQNYAEHRLANRDIEVTYLAKRAEDGRIKSIRILDANFIF